MLDVITDDASHAAASVEALRRARREGRLIACECVVAETRPALASNTELTEMLHDLGIEFVPGSSCPAARPPRRWPDSTLRGIRSAEEPPDGQAPRLESALKRIVVDYDNRLRQKFSKRIQWSSSDGPL